MILVWEISPNDEFQLSLSCSVKEFINFHICTYADIQDILTKFYLRFYKMSISQMKIYA